MSGTPKDPRKLADVIATCRECSTRFSRATTAHSPRPILWFESGARILIAGQAPGARVHASGRPFTDPSGDRLRDWMDVAEPTFYDRSRIAIVPMAFCFPGYSARKADLPPPPICAKLWRAKVMAELPNIRLTLLVGAHAQKWHLGTKDTVTQTVANWRRFAPDVFVLPHPSWRNTAWIKKNPWFERETLPALRRRLKEVLR